MQVVSNPFIKHKSSTYISLIHLITQLYFNNQDMKNHLLILNSL